jgi:hypothetical protein
MKAIIFICIAGVITGCTSYEGSASRWNDMWLDIALRHKYEKYSCGHALEGYSKDSPAAVSHRKRVTPANEQVVAKGEKAPDADLEARKQSAQRTEDSIRALSAKIDVLEDALKANAATTNHNQDLLVQQINTLKAQLSQLQQARLSEK